MRPFSFENDIPNDTPEILPIGAEWMFQIGFKIAPFAVLNLIKGFRQIQIIGREKTWFGFYSKFLQIRVIQIKILLAQRANTYQLHLSLENINNHGKLIYPQPA